MRYSLFVVAFLFSAQSLMLHAVGAEESVAPALTLTNPTVVDQDDMCIWVHPEDPSRSTVIASDKSAGKVFVYDLEGALIQQVDVGGKPGNIDLRDGFPLGGEKVSIVAFNQREGFSIQIYAVDSATRKLVRVDDGKILTGMNYGFTLYHSKKTGDFYGITVPDEGGGSVEQFRLTASDAGKITGEKVRSWPLDQSEGCVADDTTGLLYIGEEKAGIWRLGAEPDDPTPGVIVQPVGAHGLVEDVEGLALLHANGGNSYLLASCQGASRYYVYRLDEACTFVKSFSVDGATDTDGIDVRFQNFGERFPVGFFALHNGATEPYPIQLCDLRELGLALE